jgi:putative inorganic carbon (hco3(-)) transporter
LRFLVLAVFISVLFSQYPALSLAAFIGKFLKGVFLYFSFIEAFRDERCILIFLKIFLVSAFITALSGAMQHYTGKDFLKGHLVGTENSISTHRINSSFFGANGFGAYLLPVVGLVHFIFSTACTKKSWFLAAGAAFFLVLLLACLCWTYSRSSWIGYLIIVFAMVVMDRRKIFYAAALISVFMFIFMPSLNNIRHMHLISDSNVTVQKKISVHSVLEQGGSGRLAFWGKAVSIIRTSPVWGTGLNTYTRIIKRDPDPNTWWYAHNGYLQMAAETGLAGLACFLWMLFVLLRQCLQHCKQIKDGWPFSILQGSIAGLFGFLGQSFFDNSFYSVQLSMLMWMIFGLMVAVTRLNPDLQEKI